MKTYKELIDITKKGYSGLRKIKIAVLGDNSTQLLVKALKGAGFDKKLEYDIYEAEYNQIDININDPDSGLYTFKPEIVIIINSAEKIRQAFYKSDPLKRKDFSDVIRNKTEYHISTINSRLKCKVILFNLAELNDMVFGNYGTKTKDSFIFQIRKINYEMMILASKLPNLFISDISSLESHYGIKRCFDSTMYVNADMVFNLDFIPLVVKNTTDIILAICGQIKKCIILDLDNTLWGGIIGDDGIEKIQLGELGIGKAFTDFQLWLLQLKQRGIILTVCSKNEEKTAKRVFEDHPDMVLRLNDIAVFVANWNNKVDNIRYIQEVLKISYDSMVFLDDNPFERNWIKKEIPEITVPEIPEDPSEYINFLSDLNLFETISFTDEDSQRADQYHSESLRAETRVQFSSEEEYLESLDMISEVDVANEFTIPRIAQLSQRSNQFNLRTIRYTEDQLRTINLSDQYITLSFSLEDRFGDSGLICAIIMKKNNEYLFIDTWIMSCRVLKRGMENFVMNKIVSTTLGNGYSKIRGEYIPSQKNAMVKDHYQHLGFKRIDSSEVLFELDCREYKILKTTIKEKNHAD
jgi:FkbH-like protein